MSVILYSKDSQVLERWHQSLVRNYDKLILCKTYDCLLECVQQNNCVVLFHLCNLANNEHEFDSLMALEGNQEKILVLVNYPDVKQGANILHSGANGYTSADICSVKLKIAVEQVLNGNVWVDKEVLNQLLLRSFSIDNSINTHFSELKVLSKREKQIVEKVLKGKSNCQTASELAITERTVKTHINNIYRKTNTKSRLDLINKFQSSKFELI